MSKSDDLSSALNRAAGGGAPSRAPREETPARKALLLRLDPAVHRRLRMLAVEHDTTAQKLAEEALQLLFERYGADPARSTAGPTTTPEDRSTWRATPRF